MSGDSTAGLRKGREEASGVLLFPLKAESEWGWGWGRSATQASEWRSTPETHCGPLSELSSPVEDSGPIASPCRAGPPWGPPAALLHP